MKTQEAHILAWHFLPALGRKSEVAKMVRAVAKPVRRPAGRPFVVIDPVSGTIIGGGRRS